MSQHLHATRAADGEIPGITILESGPVMRHALFLSGDVMRCQVCGHIVPSMTIWQRLSTGELRVVCAEHQRLLTRFA